MNAKMIVMDLDETLLRFDKTISSYTLDTLAKCRAKGIKTVFATARSTQAASRLPEMFEPDVFIGYGGALAVAKNQILCRYAIPAEMSFELIGDCLRQPEIISIHAINEHLALTNKTGTLGADASHYQLADFTTVRGPSYLKISVVSTNPAVVERIAGHYPLCDMLRYTGEDLYRFAHRNAVKWQAIKVVAKYYDINTSHIIAFGDDVNDLEMIHNCGVGVAVANAIDACKSVADDICDTNNKDGVAKWLETNVL